MGACPYGVGDASKFKEGQRRLQFCCVPFVVNGMYLHIERTGTLTLVLFAPLCELNVCAQQTYLCSYSCIVCSFVCVNCIFVFISLLLRIRKYIYQETPASY